MIRDDAGRWVMGFSRSIGMTNSFAAELWSLREGLLLCSNLNINALEVELDAKSIVDALGNPSYVNNVISPLLDDCKLLISRIPQFCIKHCFRQANRCADSLARMSYCLGMTIFARPADTRPGPTLMGRILPGPFINRVGYGLKKKNPKRVRVGSGFY